MTGELGYTCRCCGEYHPEPPMGYSQAAPAVWEPAMESGQDCLLSSDQCVVDAQHYFVKGLIEIPVVGKDEPFCWGVWVSLSRENFSRTADLWDTPGRESQAPCFGWLTSELLVYPTSTMLLRTHVHTRRVGERPLVELEPTDHPLAVEQREGITMARVREIAEAVLHASAGGPE